MHTDFDDQRGFTLIEVIVSLVLFGLVSTMLVSVLTLGVSSTSSASQSSSGLQIARSQLESIKQQAYVEPISYATVTVPDDDFVITIGGTVLEVGFLEQIDVTVGECAVGSGGRLGFHGEFGQTRNGRLLDQSESAPSGKCSSA